MAGFLVVNEGLNLFAGDTGPNNSKCLNISSTTFPALEEQTKTHNAGGAVGELEIGGLGLKALMIGFKLTGADPQTMGLFGIGQKATQPYTIYQVLRDKNGNVPIELKCVVFGRITKMAPGEFKRGELAEQDHEIKEISHYELYYGGAELYFYDWMTSMWRVNGVQQNAAENAILRIG